MSATSPSESARSTSHKNEKPHQCKSCGAEHTSHGRLLRHKQTCRGLTSLKRSRRKSCLACVESKIKCDLAQPCSKCVTRGKDCTFMNDPQVTRDRLENPSRRRSGAIAKVPSWTSTKSPTERIADETTLRTQTPSHDQPRRLIESAISSNASTSASPQPPNSQPDSFFNSVTMPMNSSSSSGNTSDALTDNTTFVDFMSSGVFDPTQGQGHAHPMTWGDPLYQMLGTFDMNFQHVDQTPGSSSSAASENAQGSSESPSETDLQKYMHSFSFSFLTHVPMINPHVWNVRNQRPIVLSVVYACGALPYQREDPKAARLVDKALTEYRGILASEFGQSINDSDDDTTNSLIIAMALLQHLGLHSSETKHRELASLYHGMIITMIRRSGIMSKLASFIPLTLSDPDKLQSAWREWVNMEMIRRCTFAVFVQDCCQCIYFSLSPCIDKDELAFALPCDEELWRASSAQEWASILSEPSAYGTGEGRLQVVNFQHALRNMTELQASQMQTQDAVLNPGAYIILIHALLRNLYAPTPGPNKAAKINATFSTQFALHNSLRQWLNNKECMALERRSYSGANQEDQTPFWYNVLPFYWLTQVTLFAMQEGIPIAGAKFLEVPEGNRTSDMNDQGGNEREGSMLKEMRDWMAKVKTHLRAGETVPIELMQVRPSLLRK